MGQFDLNIRSASTNSPRLSMRSLFLRNNYSLKRRARSPPYPQGGCPPPAISLPGGAFHLFLRVITFRLRFRNKEEEMGTFSATDYNPNIGFFRAYHYNSMGFSSVHVMFLGVKPPRRSAGLFRRCASPVRQRANPRMGNSN